MAARCSVARTSPTPACRSLGPGWGAVRPWTWEGRALQPGVLQVCLPRVAAPQRRADGALHARRGVPHAGSSAEALQRCAARAARVRYVATTAGAATDVSRR